jgi:hypothetical protein
MLDNRHIRFVARHAFCGQIAVRSAWTRLLILVVAAQLAAACSVGMALHGEKQPDLSVLKVGAERSQVEAALLAPESVVSLPDGRTQRTYFFEVGNEPSAGRAAVHGALDILTFGLWELSGTIIEATQGDDMQVVVYDAAGKVETFDIAERETRGASPATAPPKGESRS